METILRRLLPDGMDDLIRRWRLLVAIRTCGVAGRRELASRLSLSERVLRQDIVILQTYGLIAVTAGGISVTPDGIQTIRSLEEAWPRTAEMWRAVEELKPALNGVRIAGYPAGPYAAAEMARHMEARLHSHMSVCVGGGPLIARAVARSRSLRRLSGLTVYPAQQASAEIASSLARKLGGFQPDGTDIPAILRPPDLLLLEIQEGRMAARAYGLSDDYQRLLDRKEARAEILGYFLNAEGQPVLRIKDSAADLQVIRQASEVLWIGEGELGANAFWAVRRYLSPRGILLADDIFIGTLYQLCFHRS
ncbi:sugar-binding domain-containing protein [Bianquea renquensis]|uniref:CggR N-terminal DNA binding domain-containing protein n=1 Tax=Bianquea renquensis TaxID=2763661 RepID=A0A926I1M3_9FIRM|nr:sugar-binding domain-containing protein [Bianquea renquensis]MBC8543156.1 hypothetical protein [Bianquea renquensis]